MAKRADASDGPLLLATFLKKKEISYSTFGAAVGCTKSHVCGLVRRTTKPSLDLAVRIEECTGGKVSVNSWKVTPPPGPTLRNARA